MGQQTAKVIKKRLDESTTYFNTDSLWPRHLIAVNTRLLRRCHVTLVPKKIKEKKIAKKEENILASIIQID